jgi:hypothetical protein
MPSAGVSWFMWNVPARRDEVVTVWLSTLGVFGVEVVDLFVTLDSCSSSCLICLLSNSASRVDPRLADVEGLVDDAAVAEIGGRPRKVFPEHIMCGSSGEIEDSDPLDSGNHRRSAAWLAVVRLGGGDRDAYSQFEFLERMQLLHGDSRLHFILRLRHSVHELHC